MQLSGLIAIDEKQMADFEYLRPHYGIHSFVKLRSLNNNASLPDVDVGVFAAWFDEEEELLK